jgi:hypothetical protein
MTLQFPIKWLLAAVGFCGVAFAALRSASDWWAGGVFTATLLGLALATAYAFQRRGARRASWAAFAAFGWGYLLLAFGPWCETSIRPRLLTTKVLDTLWPIVHPEPEGIVRLWDAATGKPIDAVKGVHRVTFSPDGRLLSPVTATSPAREPFQDIGHSLAALLLAAIGGLAARYLYANRDERRKEAAEKAAGVMPKVIEAGL